MGNRPSKSYLGPLQHILEKPVEFILIDEVLHALMATVDLRAHTRLSCGVEDYFAIVAG